MEAFLHFFIKKLISERIKMIHEHVNLGISIGNFLIPYYGLMIVLGLFAAFWVAYFQVKKYNLSIDDFILIAATSGLFAIIGSKLLFFIK